MVFPKVCGAFYQVSEILVLGSYVHKFLVPLVHSSLSSYFYCGVLAVV